jgi:hypothetical protein
MRLLFVGSIPRHEPGIGQAPTEEHEMLFKASEEIGYAAVKHSHTVLIGSDSKNTIDYYIARGAIRYCEENPDKSVTLEVHRPEHLSEVFSERPNNLSVSELPYHHDRSLPHQWIVSHVRALDSCDILITLGGGTSTRLVGNIAADRQMPVIAVASFGGSSEELYERLKYLYKERIGTSDTLRPLTKSWHSEFAEEIIMFAEALYKARAKQKPHLYFLSYSWNDSSIADHVEALLRRSNRNVLRDEDNVRSGGSLSKAIEALIDQADTFVALWSEAYAKSTWCPNELEYALNRHAGNLKPSRIVLFTLDNTLPPIRFTDTLRPPGSDRTQRQLAIVNLLKDEI